MTTSRKGITRRDFIRNSAGAVAGMAALPALAQDTAASPQKSTVVLIRDAAALDAAGQPNADVLPRMLDEAVVALTGEADAAAAWRKLIKAEDTVGIKTNRWQYLPTPECLEESIKRRAMETGVAEAKIAIEDYAILDNPVFQQATALINIRPMRTHHWAGVGSCIKNYIMFSDKPSSWHADACANLAGVWDLPVCKGKTRLNVLVMLTPQFHGKGPHHFNKKYTWAYKGLIAGADPVAVDATGLRIIEAKRKEFFENDEPFAVPPHHIRFAEEKFHLGFADPAKIDIKKIGWDEAILI